MAEPIVLPVIRAVRFFLAHPLGLVRHGSKPARDLADGGARRAALAAGIQTHLRDYAAAVAYPAHRAFLGALAGVALALPVYHITEEGVKRQISPGDYEQQVALTEIVIDVAEIAAAVKAVCESNGV